MQTFRPFRATFVRQQKYYSEKRPKKQSKGSIFNLPRQIIGKRSLSVINPEITFSQAQLKQQNKFISDYQKNLKKTAVKHSKQILNRKTLQTVVNSYIEKDEIQPQYKIIRNRSTQLYTNKNMAFKTLNILYRTIIQTKVRRKPKQKFQLSAKKLPIIQKMSPQKKPYLQFLKNSSFDKLKTNLTTINNNELQNSQSSKKYEMKQIETNFINRDNQKYWTKRRFGYMREKNETKVQNQIIPWNQENSAPLMESQWFY